MPKRDALARLYKATTFRVESPAGYQDIRIGEHHSEIDRLMDKFSATEWAYITAWNPGSRPGSPADNSAAQGRLLQLLHGKGLRFYEGDGIPENPGWQPERSVWIAGINRQEALQIGAQFGQNAIVVGELGAVAELLFCDLSREGFL